MLLDSGAECQNSISHPSESPLPLGEPRAGLRTRNRGRFAMIEVKKEDHGPVLKKFERTTMSMSQTSRAYDHSGNLIRPLACDTRKLWEGACADTESIPSFSLRALQGSFPSKISTQYSRVDEEASID